MKKRILNIKTRAVFAQELHKHMMKNDKIWVITNDLGYKMWDQIRKDFPDRFLNVGAAEQSLIGVATGLALEGKIPFVYSITTFLLYRPFETIRNYIDHEKIPVRLVGAGRDRDYGDLGFSHWSEEDKEVMKIFKNIKSQWPDDPEIIPSLVEEMVSQNIPWYVNLKR